MESIAKESVIESVTGKIKMSESQERAVKHFKGPGLVLAGPGSGKTFTITHRTRMLVEEHAVNPSNILVITFTKAAADEMQKRFEGMMGGQRVPVTFGTFHAVFFKILKYAYNYTGANVISEKEKFIYIKELVEKEGIDTEDINDMTTSIISELGAVKGDMIDVSNYYAKSCGEDAFRRIYARYDEMLRKRNKVDFDDMLVMCHELLSKRSDILAAWQKKYQYILIDEFQDINRIQYEIMKMLALPENNLFVVGDDDQSIYHFRGARPEIMLGFEKDFPGTKRIVLEENYRSSKEIVEISQRLIKNNKVRFEKNIKAAGENKGPVVFMNFENQNKENEYLVSQIRKDIEGGLKYSDIAVIFRTNAGPRFLVEKLMGYNIPFRMKDKMPNMYEHFIAKDFFSYVRLATGKGTRADFLQIINRPKRYISRDALNSETVNTLELKKYYVAKKWMYERIEKLEFDFRMLMTMTPFAAVNYIRQGIEYDKFIEEYSEYRKISKEELYEVADEIAEAAKPYKTYDEWFEFIDEYSKELIKQERENRVKRNAVELVTMHASKGLEYDSVYIVDAVEGVTPHSKTVLDEDMEEERRMFYVAATRAKNKLSVYSTEERYGKPVTVSRFVGEMKVDLDGLTVGGNVKHMKYGQGKIKYIDDEKIQIYFPRLKKDLVFNLKYVLAKGIIS